MNRLHKKCVVASTGVHLLIGLVVFVGPAFTSSNTAVVEDLPIINFVPDILVDENVVGGGNPKAGRAPEPQPEPQPPPPEPKRQPPEPVQAPDPDSFAEAKPNKPKTPKISLKLETKNPSKSAVSETQAREREDARARQVARAFSNSSKAIRQGASSTLTIEEGSFGPGGGGPAYASYRAWVQTVYDRAWIAPADTTVDAAVAKVRVTILRDGTIRSAEFLSRSGDSQVDASIQRALDRVSTIGKPFPAGAKENERSYILRFDLKVKRGLT
jgi:outer membrane biosynthesis protein TonB